MKLSELTKLSYSLIVIADYPPYIWTEDHRRWFKEYLDACARYWAKCFKENWALDVELGFETQIPETVYPNHAVEGRVAQETLEWTAKGVRENGFDGLILLGKHEAYFHAIPGFEKRAAMAWPIGHWAYIKYYPPMVNWPLPIYQTLVDVGHEWLHLILYDNGNKPFDTARIDFPPYRTADTYTKHWFEGKYPVQALPVLGS